MLQIHSPDWIFAPYRVDVALDDKAGDKQKDVDERLRVEVYRTFLGNSWSEKGEWKGRYVGGSTAATDTAAGAATPDTASSGDAGNNKAQPHREKELKVELEVVGRKEYYNVREGCKCKFLSVTLLMNIHCDAFDMILLARGSSATAPSVVDDDS